MANRPLTAKEQSTIEIIRAMNHLKDYRNQINRAFCRDGVTPRRAKQCQA